MKALLLTSNAAATAVADGGTLSPGSAVHGFGRGIRLSGNTIQLTEAGYYLISANVSYAVTGTGAATIELYSNGSAVNGATASATPAAAGAVVDLSLTWVIRKTCCCDSTAITFVMDGAGTANNTVIEVQRI